MLTKIMTALLLGLLGVIVWMALSHRADLESAAKVAGQLRDDLGAANEAKGAANTRAEQAENLNKTNAAFISTLNSDLQLQRELVQQQQDRAEEIQTTFDQLNRRYQEALQNDPQTRDWASTDLPDSVASGGLLYRAKAATGTQGGHVDRDKGEAGPGAGAAPVPAAGGEAPGQR